jgi:chromate transporter
MASFPFLFWLRMGLLSWGGPGAQIALLEQECVQKRGWLTAEAFTRALGLCLILPGPEAQQ